MRIIDAFLSLIHLVIFFLSAGVFLNGIISPERLSWVNLLSLSFPFLIILYVILCGYWLIRWKRRSFFFLFLMLFLFKPLQAWINFSGKSEKEAADLKVISFNIKMGAMGRERLNSYLEEAGADIVFAQEYGKTFELPGNPFHTTRYPITALASKTEILSQGKIATGGNGNAFYADVKIKGKTLRLINVYLAPFAFDKKEVRPTRSLDRNESKAKNILHRLLPIFKSHQRELDDIVAAIKNSPHPVILAGDFNAVPYSYEYLTVRNLLDDAFLKAGNGSATSFHDYKFPLRIDYIFASKELRPVRYHVDRSVRLSDHFPVIAEFKLKK